MSAAVSTRPEAPRTDLPMAPSPPTVPKPQSTSRASKNMVSYETGREVALPDLRGTSPIVDKTKPLPTSLQSDFLPEDVLFSLTQPPVPQEQLGPPPRFRNLNVTNDKSRKKAANMWNFPSRREKFKHLTESTSCNCGAGKDISFLYDVSKPDEKSERPDLFDKSQARKEPSNAKPMALPDTLIPEEYHIVKNKGVMGLEYYDDKYTTKPEDHEKHLVMFPSMKPTSRYEVLQLKQTMADMIEKLGVDNLEVEVKGPTQMHNLLEIIKKEQNIYNVIFHELIRQVSVECMERGELLADLRQKYCDLLNKVPRQIKSLHEEVMAQRALDRRLTEELMRFKSTIGVLTDELSGVKEHDRKVTAEAHQAREDLKQALIESEKNASLLSEYHDLYELQRKRLEKSVTTLTDEKELWSTAAYCLALKVTEEHNLNTAQRLHVSEKAWAKLANHFTILLSDKDTEGITALTEYVDTWRQLTEDFNDEIVKRETDMKEALLTVKAGIEHWIDTFRRVVLNKDGQFSHTPLPSTISELYGSMKQWEENTAKIFDFVKQSGKLLAKEMEKFAGDNILTMEDSLISMQKQMEQWTDCALKIFARHKSEDGKDYPEHGPMHKMNEMYDVVDEIEELVKQYMVRLTGENGTARVLIHLGNGLDTWDNKLNTVLHGGGPIKEQDWLYFYQNMDDWLTTIEEGLTCIGLTQKEEDRSKKAEHTRIDVMDVFKNSQKWLTSAVNGIDSEDAKLVGEVSTLHTEMVRWMVQMLLRLAPDKQPLSDEGQQRILSGTISVGQLKANAKNMFERLDNFSRYVTRCCMGIVSESVQKKQDAMEENADMELRDLNKLKTECDEWIHTASIMVTELTGEEFEYVTKPNIDLLSIASESKPVTPATPGKPMTPGHPETPLVTADTPGIPQTPATAVEGYHDMEKLETAEQDQEKPSDEHQPPVSAPSEDQKPTDHPDGVADDQQTLGREDTTVTSVVETPGPEEEGEKREKHVTIQEPEEVLTVEMIGKDSNTHIKMLDQTPDAPPIAADGKPRPDTPNTKRAYEAIAAVESLQNQLIETEQRAQSSEERAIVAEKELIKTQETIRALERKINELMGQPEPPKEEEKRKEEVKKEEKKEEKPEEAAAAAVPTATVTPPPKEKSSSKPPSAKKDSRASTPSDGKRPDSRLSTHSRASSRTSLKGRKK